MRHNDNHRNNTPDTGSFMGAAGKGKRVQKALFEG